MQRIKNSTVVSELPTYVGNSADPGYFADQNVGLGQEGTVVDAAFLNGIQEELLAVIEAADVAPSPTDLTQLLQALQAGFGMNQGSRALGSPHGPGFWVTLPGGYMLQLGTYVAQMTSGVDYDFEYPTPFTDTAFGVLLQRRDYFNDVLTGYIHPTNNDTHFQVRSPHASASDWQSFYMFAIGK